MNPNYLILVILGIVLVSCATEPEKFVSDKPEESRFTKVTLVERLDEPMEFEVLQDGRIIFIERKGKVRMFEPATGLVKDIGSIPVYFESEDGLLGFAKDPDFYNNHWIYLYYSPEGKESINRLSRFTLVSDILDPDSEAVLLEIPQFRGCCHSGGSIEFDSKGNLFLSLGDDTTPFESDNYNPIDERPGRPENVDAQRSSSNSNDLRGSILRITPQSDGTYTIPDGNLFPAGTPNTRPEIYVMGNRNPFRISVDPKSGFLYWGEVGPDAQNDSLGRGPRGHDEVNQAKEAGFYGWPYFVGDNKPYWYYDFEKGESVFAYDPAAPVNHSPNNTGVNVLPPAQEAMIWYPYADSEEFPMLGSGGRNAMAGPVYYQDLFADTAVKFPKYYDGKLFIYDWMRNWVFAVQFDEEGDFAGLEEFMPTTQFDKPIDMQFGPDGALYVLEYGTYWNSQNDDSGIYRIEFNPGIRKPIARSSADVKQGAAPLEVQFSSAGSMDLDGDNLTFEWDFYGDGSNTSREDDPVFVFERVGEFNTILTVRDSEGLQSQTIIPIAVGNEPPVIQLTWEGNRSFYWGKPTLSYRVDVQDKEDGLISENEVVVTWDFLEEGYDKIIAEMGHQQSENSTQVLGQNLLVKSGCNACHGLENASVGPSYKAVAERYSAVTEAPKILLQKVINGGGGVWGDRLMPSHAHLKEGDIVQMLDYVLSLSPKSAISQKNRLGISGEVTLDQHRAQGTYLLTASYRDKGANGISPILRREQLMLRHPLVLAANADFFHGAAKANFEDSRLVKFTEDKSYIGFERVDLKYVGGIQLSVDPSNRTGWFEVRLHSPDGPIVGKSGVISNELKPEKETGKWFDVSVKLETYDQVADLYLVFQTETGVSIWSSFLLNTVYFDGRS
ncbi:MAG: PQQ-dependent sugar dehydrogenase [Lunatimonas sp.]|uniref:PQQ-dependent sugar dehydrogenase n=1 Tax=Lunatimonas sp. TaxID=2060141 RepID=UPI00263B0F00|nr:PQQ-dependent sugar dehydrogenase [Lunatimonas sp.]MCC5939296.1 PQQ-dependent sugar dehydrogenase [Lunatimonas sp.]